MKYIILILLNLILINNQSFSQVKTISINSSLEMYGKDLGLMNWDDANIECKKLGNGWRLPNKNELDLIIPTNQLTQLISYWTSTTDAKNRSYNNCFVCESGGNYDYKNFQLLVRPVRSLSDFKLTLLNKNEPDASFILNDFEIMYQDLDLDNFKELFDKKGVNLSELGYDIGKGYSYHYYESHGYKFKENFYNSKEFSYNSVLKIIELIGNDWRLPTLNELKIIYTNKSIIPNLNKIKQQEYLSIGKNINDKENQLVNIVDLRDGRIWRDYNKNNRGLSVRLVKSLKSKISLSDTLSFKKRTIKIDYLEIMSDDIGFMNHNEAIKLSSELGNGWRLPTRYEVDHILFKFENIIGGFQDFFNDKNGYWFIPEGNVRNFEIYLPSIIQPIENWKTAKAFVRLVRDVYNDTIPYIINTKKVGNLEIMSNDIGKMNYEFAKFSSNNYGEGWRLPTNNELILMYSNKDKIGKFSNNSYWSIEEIDETRAGTLDFGKGILNFKNKIVDRELTGLKDWNYYVRLVRTRTTNGNFKFGNLEVYNHDLGKMNWEAAINKCKQLGNGWRLPNDDELNILYKNKNTITGLSKSIYWSSSKSQLNKARYLFILSGVKGEEVLSSNFNVRPVRIAK